MGLKSEPEKKKKEDDRFEGLWSQNGTLSSGNRKNMTSLSSQNVTVPTGSRRETTSMKLMAI